MEKKLFQAPEVTVMRVELSDVICASATPVTCGSGANETTYDPL